MCGIIGYVGDRECRDILFRGLRKLEYRGYDSAGISIVHEGGFKLLHSVGNLDNLEAVLPDLGDGGTVGIAHTRWATHGRPSNENAHPHTDCAGALRHRAQRHRGELSEPAGRASGRGSRVHVRDRRRSGRPSHRAGLSGLAAEGGRRGLPADGGALHLLRRGCGRAGRDRGDAQRDSARGGLERRRELPGLGHPRFPGRDPHR